MQPNTPIPVLPNPPKISMDVSLLDGLPSGQDPSSTSAHISPNPASSLTPIQPDHKNMSQQNHTNQEVPNIPKPKFVPYPNPNNPVITEVKAPSNLTPTMPAPPKPLPSTYQQPNLKGVYKAKRVIIIGDAGVGKTCLSFRFCNGRFPGQTEATIGVDFRERALVLDNELIRVQLWDTAGQERYRQSIVAHYYRNVNAVVYVYDVTNPESFRSLPSWINECKKHAVHCSDDTPHILIGNKCDLMAENRVKTDEAQVFADQNDMAHFETSALADSESDHVESIFMTLVHKLRHSKPMHVQTDQERVEKEQKLLLKADEAAKLEDQEGFCC